MSGYTGEGVDTAVGLLHAAIEADPARPVLTYYDDATGERTELSGLTLVNWVNKTANLLVDGHGLGPADRVAVLLPPHWQTAAVLLACWSGGLTVTTEGPAAVAFAAVDRLDEAGADEVYGLALAPLAAPIRPGPPPGVLDYVVEVRGYGDQFRAAVGGAAPATPDLTQAELVHQAVLRATGLGMSPGARVLLDAGRLDDPVDWLLAPLAAGASIVLCGHLDPALVDGRVATERITLKV